MIDRPDRHMLVSRSQAPSPDGAGTDRAGEPPNVWHGQATSGTSGPPSTAAMT
jgi:hypothetical protein